MLLEQKGFDAFRLRYLIIDPYKKSYLMRVMELIFLAGNLDHNQREFHYHQTSGVS